MENDDLIDYNLNSKYCVYSCDKPPDTILNGKYFFNCKPDEYFIKKPYLSKVLINPTYKDIFINICDEYIETTEDTHYFFEDIEIKGQINEQGLIELSLIMGS